MEYNQLKMRFEVNKNLFKKFTKNNKKITNIDKFYYSENLIRKFIRQTIRGLNYLHRIGIIHGDIKTK